jgi:hypothetical protein
MHKRGNAYALTHLCIDISVEMRRSFRMKTVSVASRGSAILALGLKGWI